MLVFFIIVGVIVGVISTVLLIENSKPVRRKSGLKTPNRPAPGSESYKETKEDKVYI